MTWDDLSFMRFTDKEIKHMEIIGLDAATVLDRSYNKWTRKEILEVPRGVKRSHFYKKRGKYNWNSIRFLDFNDNEIKTMESNGITPTMARKRYYKGWTKEEIINTKKYQHRKQAI